MNKDIFKGKWNQIKGKVKEKWGKLTDDDLKRIDGNLDQLSGKIQERYGYAKEKVEKELSRFASEHNLGSETGRSREQEPSRETENPREKAFHGSHRPREEENQNWENKEKW